MKINNFKVKGLTIIVIVFFCGYLVVVLIKEGESRIDNIVLFSKEIAYKPISYCNQKLN